MLLFEDRYNGADKQSFIDKVQTISFKLGIDPNWLMYVMYNESGLNPQSVATYYKFTGCGGGYGVGLIGFTPCTLQNVVNYPYGWESFKQLSGTDQLDYVYTFFKRYAGQIKNYADLHLVTAFPAALGQSRDFIFESPSEGISAQEYAKGNPGFDLNKDGIVTLQEFYDWQDNRARTIVPSGFLDSFINTSTNQTTQWNFVQTHQRDLVIAGFIAVMGILLVIIVFLLIRTK